MTQFSYGVLLQVLKLCSPKKTTQKFLCGNIFLSVNPQYDITNDDGTVAHIKRCDRELSSDVTDFISSAKYEDVYRCFSEVIIPCLNPDNLSLVIGSLSYIVANASNIDDAFPICARDQRTKSFYLHPGAVDLPEFLTDLFLFSAASIPNPAGADFVKISDTKKKLEAFTIDINSFHIITRKNTENIQTENDVLSDIDRLNELAARVGELKPIPKPPQIAPCEQAFIVPLYNAYGSINEKKYSTKQELPDHLQADMEIRRDHFYKAETVRIQGANALGDMGAHHFAILKDEMFASVYNVCFDDYKNGFIRMKKVMSQATIAICVKSVFSRTNWVGSEEKQGICHILAGEKRLLWVVPDE